MSVRFSTTPTGAVDFTEDLLAYEKGRGMRGADGRDQVSMEKYLWIGMIIMAAAAWVLLLAAVLLFAKCGRDATARILSVEAKEKYYDSTRRKRIAYDYVYEYTDENGDRHRGKLIKNTPRVEYMPDQEITIRYLRFCPVVSFHPAAYRSLASVPWVVTVILALLILLYLHQF